MNNIKVFTAIGAVVAFSGYTSDVFGAVNSNNEHSAVEDSLGYWTAEDNNCVAQADAGRIGQYELVGYRAENDVKAEGLQKISEANGGGGGVEETPVYSGYDELIKEVSSNSSGNPDEGGWHIDNKKYGGKSSTPEWKLINNGWRCAGPRITYVDKDGNEIKNYCRPSDRVNVYFCPTWKCHACDVCNAASYNICAISYDGYEGTEGDKCNLEEAKKFYNKLISWLSGIKGTIDVRDDRAMGNFYANTRGFHELGKKGEASSRIEQAYIEVGEGVLAQADAEWVDLAINYSGSDKLNEAARRQNAGTAGLNPIPVPK